MSEERLVQVTINISLDFPDDVSDRELEFYLNEGSWCWDNLIDILQEHSNKYGCICDICEGKVLGKKVINKLPSAEVRTQMSSADLISREDTLEIINKMKEVYFDRKVVLGKVYDQIKDMPSAERVGKWIVDDGYIDCSYCRHAKWSRVPFEQLVRGFRFCPNCGARMVSEYAK